MRQSPRSAVVEKNTCSSSARLLYTPRSIGASVVPMAISLLAYRFFRTGLIVSFRAELRSRRGDLDHRPLDAGDRVGPRCAHGQRDCTARRRQARMRRVAIMCAEMLWWQCHRGLIADYLKAREYLVTHIAAGGTTEPHPFTSAAQIIDGRLSYHGLLAA